MKSFIKHLYMNLLTIQILTISEGKRPFHRCGANGKWHRPDKVNQKCLPEGK